MAMAKVAVIPGSNTEKGVIMASSFVTGVLLGFASMKKPTWGMPLTLGVGALGIAGALFTEGIVGDMAEGLANCALGTLGASIPYYLSSSGGATAAKALPPGARRMLPPPASNKVALSPMFDRIQQA